MSDSLACFQAEIADAGLGQPEIVADGKIHRFNVPGGKKRNRAGWYILFLDGVPAGSFGDWRTAEKHYWCATAESDLTTEEKAEYRKSIEKARAERDDAQRLLRSECATSARISWSKLKSAPEDHPYLQRKRIKPHIAKIKGKDLVIPVTAPRADGKGTEIVGLQYIAPCGEKRFLLGTQKKGAFCLIAGSLKGADLVVICEGFSTAATVHEATGMPTFIAFDCGNLKSAAEAIRKQYPKAAIVIAGDNDCWKGEVNPGLEAAKEAAKAVNGSWRIPDFTGLDTSAKPTDFNDLAALAGLGAVKMQIEVARTQATKTGGQATPYPTVSTEDADGKKKSQATILIELSADLKYIVNHDGDVFVMIERDGHSECWPARSKDFTEWLSQAFYWTTNKGCNRNALSDAMNTIEARAKDRCKKRCNVYIRVANSGDRIYINPCDEKWHAIEVDADGWRVLDKPPIHFTRKRGMSAFPNLEGLDGTDKKGAALLGASIDSLKSFLNIEENDFPLVIGWLMAALGGSAPYPILVLQGEQGTGKSTTSKVIRSLVDPSTSPLRSPPREIRDLLVSAVNNHVVVLDNLSGLPPDISDALCRLSTGGAIDARQLYTNLEQVLVEIQRPVIVNGIDDIATRPDLAERSIILNLPGIRDDDRQDEKTFWANFEKARPQILALLLDGLVMALKCRDSVKLEHKPRMADFALWAKAAEPAFGWDDDEFIKAYGKNQNEAVAAGIDASPVGTALLALMAERDRWSGKPTELLAALEDIAGERQAKSRAWPQSTKGLANILKRLAPPLRKVGVEVTKLASGSLGRPYIITRSDITVPNDLTCPNPVTTRVPDGMDRNPNQPNGTDRNPNQPARNPHGSKAGAGWDGWDGYSGACTKNTSRSTNKPDRGEV